MSREDLDAALDAARERAEMNGVRMLAGEIDRDPLKGKCNKYCEFQPICRLERAVGLEEDGENGGTE